MVYPAGSIKMGSGNNYHPNGMHIQLDLYKWGQVITIIQSIYPAGTITVKKPRVINAFLSFRNAFLNQKREREHFEAFRTVL